MCDLAEVYHIYDFRALPVKTLAALSVGLREDSRIKMKMSGMKYISPVVLGAAIADQLSLIRYALTAQKGDRPPALYTDLIFDRSEGKVQKNTKAFDAARREIFARVEASLEGADNV